MERIVSNFFGAPSEFGVGTRTRRYPRGNSTIIAVLKNYFETVIGELPTGKFLAKVSVHRADVQGMLMDEGDFSVLVSFDGKLPHRAIEISRPREDVFMHALFPERTRLRPEHLD